MTTSTAVHSNAFNFMNFIHSQVDPRTGQYTCTVALPELKGNHLAGPSVPLQLGFNPLNRDDSGFGRGWNLQLSQFDTLRGVLSLHTGETFKVSFDHLGNTVIPEQKLDSFHFIKLDQYCFEVAHKSGLIERLEVVQGSTALPVEMRSPQGHRVTLDYTTFNNTQPLLSTIRNADGSVLLNLQRYPAALDLVVFPGSPFEALFSLQILSGQTRKINLPTHDQAAWCFDYITLEGLPCLQRVQSPSGSLENVTYSSRPHRFPAPSNSKLPRVEAHTVHPGAGQPSIETRFAYDSGDYNFLGFNSGLKWADDGLDQLYKDEVSSAYTYETTEMLWDGGHPVRTTRRVYNRFHLLELEVVTQPTADANKGYATLETRTEYHLRPGERFDDQPAYCQLPKTISQVWYYSGQINPRHKEQIHTTYDNFGNLLKKVDANGVIETQEWYPATGADGCPADPQGFVRSLKRKTVIPANTGLGNAPVLQTDYRYSAQPGLADSGVTWLAMSEETLGERVDGRVEGELTRIERHYVNAPQDALRHGLISLLRQTFLDRADTITRTEYAYQKTTSSHAGIPALRTQSTLIGHDDTRKTITQEIALHSGLNLLSDDGDGAVTCHEYDLMGRVTRETVAPGTPYAASRTYTYALTNGSPLQQAMQTATDVKGVTTVTWLDGLDRVVREERQDADALGGDPRTLRETYRAQYNPLGQLAAETAIDWEGAQDIALTSHFAYDAWGQQCRIVGADGVAQASENDPTTLTLRTWTESTDSPPKTSNMSRTTFNLFGKQDKLETLVDKRTVLTERLFRYDGLGNCVEQDDENGNTTLFSYDLFSRMQQSTLPTGEIIRQTYAAHSGDALAASIAVLDGSTLAAKTIGTQDYDGLGRRTAVQVGPRLQRFEYEGGLALVSKSLTASGRSISYAYVPELVGTPVSVQTEEEPSTFNYDAASAHLTVSSNTQGQHAFDYSNSGQLLSERWTDSGGKQWHTQYSQTLKGRPLTRRDADGLLCTYSYDEWARVKRVRQGQLMAVLEYDSLGRADVITTHNQHTGQILQTRLTFDVHGRETQRRLLLSGQAEQTVDQVYQEDGKLRSRHLQVAGNTELLETFDYDRRGRMIGYTCAGTQLPRDRYGNAIIEQLFEFDALDNVTYVYSHFADGSVDHAISSFAAHDPCQLKRITHMHPSYPQQVDFDYDADGNLLRDELGQALHYDSQGRLLKVTDTGKVVSQYRYDAHNHLLGVTRGVGEETLRFYQGDRLSRTEQGDTSIHFLYSGSQPLGQQTQGEPDKTLLLLSDGKNSVLAESDGKDTLRKAIYNAYGERTPQGDPGQEMQCLLGFNGEVRDERSGWYLLGRGYRAYNPHLMRFHSPDSLSPFGAGGINSYAYCAGDPINFSDPTGHRREGDFGSSTSMGLSIALMIFTGIFTVAAAIAFPPSGFVSGALYVGFGALDIFGMVKTGTYIHQAKHGSSTQERREAGDRAQSEATWGFIGSLLPFAFPAIGKAFKSVKGASKAAADGLPAALKEGVTTSSARSSVHLDQPGPSNVSLSPKSSLVETPSNPGSRSSSFSGRPAALLNIAPERLWQSLPSMTQSSAEAVAKSPLVSPAPIPLKPSPPSWQLTPYIKQLRESKSSAAMKGQVQPNQRRRTRLTGHLEEINPVLDGFM